MVWRKSVTAPNCAVNSAPKDGFLLRNLEPVTDFRVSLWALECGNVPAGTPPVVATRVRTTPRPSCWGPWWPSENLQRLGTHRPATNRKIPPLDGSVKTFERDDALWSDDAYSDVVPSEDSSIRLALDQSPRAHSPTKPVKTCNPKQSTTWPCIGLHSKAWGRGRLRSKTCPSATLRFLTDHLRCLDCLGLPVRAPPMAKGAHREADNKDGDNRDSSLKAEVCQDSCLIASG